MPSLILYSSKETKAKGLQKTTLHLEKMQEYFFSDEYSNLKLLNQIPAINLPSCKPTIFYPSCGPNIFTTLIYIKKTFSQNKRNKFNFHGYY